MALTRKPLVGEKVRLQGVLYTVVESPKPPAIGSDESIVWALNPALPRMPDGVNPTLFIWRFSGGNLNSLATIQEEVTNDI